MSILLTANHESSYGQICEILEAGGANLNTFDDEGAKTFLDLSREVKNRDVVLTFDTTSWRTKRHAQSIKIIVTDPIRQLRWLEVERRFPNGKVIKKVQEFAIRETRKREESPQECAIRALKEEVKFVPRPSLDSLRILEEPEWIDEYESTVYAHMDSVVTSLQYELHTSNFARKMKQLESGLITVRDYGDAGDVPGNDNWVETDIRAFPI